MDQQNHVSSYPFLGKDGAIAKNAYMFNVVKSDGTQELLSDKRLRQTISWACAEYKAVVDEELILQETVKNIFDGISTQEIADALILSASGFIERDPAYSKVAVKLQLKNLFRAVTGYPITCIDQKERYIQSFIDSITVGLEHDLLDKRFQEFDIHYLAQHLRLERDVLFD